jgi:hypothetical protein
MSDTKTPAPLPPLVSDEQVDTKFNFMCYPHGDIAAKMGKGLRDIYEADREESAAKIAHLGSLNEQKYNEGFTEASRIHGVQIARLEGLVQALVNDMQDFVDKVDRGEAKSKRSYAAFKHRIEVAKSQLNIEPTKP